METSEAFWTLNNLSTHSAVSTFQQREDTYAYLTVPNIARGVDYETNTYAIKTKCAVTPEACSIGCYAMDDSGYVELDATCGENFQESLIGDSSIAGDVNTSLIYLSNNNPETAQSVAYTRANPFSFAILAMSKSFNTGLQSDAEHFLTCSGAGGESYVVWMATCDATIYDVRYRWTNGTFDGVVSMNLSSTKVAGTLSTPFATTLGRTTLFNMALTAFGEGNAVAVANTFSLVFSKTALALAAGVMTRTQNVDQGEVLIGARVEKAPLYTLLCFNLLYVVLAVAFAVLALLSGPSRLQDIQARLSVVGLTAQCFEGERVELPVNKLSELFAESDGDVVQRVGVVQTSEGGWKYKLLKEE